MSASFGKITAVLAEKSEEFSEELITLLNKNVKPPRPVAAGDVYIRAMYVVSDEINSFGGRFPADEHSRLVSLLIDSPVLAGHRKDKLPLGRNFYAACENRGGRQWVKSYFYWLKSGHGAESLRENIDGGIYKECSIGFTYFFPECSVCGYDIRRCEHQPFQKQITHGVESITHFNYRKIERVLETSLVYRGALPDTAVTKDLDESSAAQITPEKVESAVLCRLEQIPYSDNARLIMKINGRTVLFIIRQFNLNRLRHHVRFPAELSKVSEHVSDQLFNEKKKNSIGNGTVIGISEAKGQYLIRMEGGIDGLYVLRSLNIKAELQWFFYKLQHKQEGDHDNMTSSVEKKGITATFDGDNQ